MSSSAARPLLLVAAVLARMVSSDHILRRLYLAPASSCGGAFKPLDLVALPAGCRAAGDGAWIAYACVSSSAYALRTFDNAQCGGTPQSASTTVVGNCSAYVTAAPPQAGWVDGVCVAGAFDPSAPEAHVSVDVYTVEAGAAGGGACPPAGAGVSLQQRMYLDTSPFPGLVPGGGCAAARSGGKGR